MRGIFYDRWCIRATVPNRGTDIRTDATNMKLKIAKRYITHFFKRAGVTIIALVVLFFLLNWIFPLPDKIEYSTIVTDSKGEVIIKSIRGEI
jgi:hypothetical protein